MYPLTFLNCFPFTIWQVLSVLKDLATVVIAICSFVVAVKTFKISTRNTRRNLRLTIQQALLKTAMEKAKDCNSVWERQDTYYQSVYTSAGKGEYHFSLREFLYDDVVSEVLMSTEVLDTAFHLYNEAGEFFSEEEKKKYIRVFWKNLKTSIRELVVDTGIEMVIDSEHLKDIRGTYGHQLLSILKFIPLDSEIMEKFPKEDRLVEMQRIIAINDARKKN